MHLPPTPLRLCDFETLRLVIVRLYNFPSAATASSRISIDVENDIRK